MKLSRFERKLLRKIQYLLLKSLVDKWWDDSNKPFKSLCAFCNDTEIRLDAPFPCNCEVCLCPDSICDLFEKQGYIEVLYEIYDDNNPVCDLEPKDLKHMQNLFFEEIMRINTIFRENKVK